MRVMVILWALSCYACAGAKTYRAQHYQFTSADAVKRIEVRAWAEDEVLAKLLAELARDRTNLKKNYLVYDAGPQTMGWASHCEDRQGVLSIRALDSQITGNKSMLNLEMSLFRCRDGALLFRSIQKSSGKTEDKNLNSMTDAYLEKFGAKASPYVAPAFLALRKLLDDLDDVVLNDEEIMEKIELE